MGTFLFGPRHYFDLINNLIVILSLTALAIASLRRKQVDSDFVIVRRGIVVFVLFALYDNLDDGCADRAGQRAQARPHHYDAAQTMSRILDSFPESNQSQIRQQLSLALLAVIAQQLVPAIGHVGRYPAVEIMMATPAIRNLIRTGKDHQLRSHISTGRGDGMITMDQSLAELVRAGRISRETASAHCYHPDELRSHLNDQDASLP